MTNSQRLATVRKRILSWISDVDPCQEHRIIERETTLIRDDFYVGRRFYTPTHRAVWFIEQDELKIYDGEGQLVCVLQADEIDATDMSVEAREPEVIRLPDVRPDTTPTSAANSDSHAPSTNQRRAA